MNEVLKNNEVRYEAKPALEVAENLLAFIESDTPHPDQAVADFVEDTGEAFDAGIASFTETVIADEVGLLRAVEDRAESEETIGALANTDQAPYEIAVAAVERMAEDEAFVAVTQRVAEIAEAMQREYSMPDTETIPADREPSVHYIEARDDQETVEQPQKVEEQLQAIETAVESEDMKALLVYLQQQPVVDRTVLATLIDSVGDASFEADTWSDNDEEKTLGEIGFLIGKKASLLPAAERPAVYESMVARGGARVLVNTLYRNEADRSLAGDILYRHNEFSKLASNIEFFPDIEPNDLIDKLFETDEVYAIPGVIQKIGEAVDVKRVEALYFEQCPDQLAYNKELFPDADDERLIKKLYEDGMSYVVASNISKFPDVDKAELALACIEQNSGWILASKPEVLEGIDLEPIEKRLREAGDFDVFLKQREKFPGVSLDEIVDGMIAHRRASNLVDAIGEVPGITAEAVYQKIIDAKQSWSIVADLKKFPDVDTAFVMRSAVEEGSAWVVVDNLSVLDSEQARLDMMNVIVASGQGLQLVDKRGSIEQTDDELAALFVAHGKYAQLISAIEKLETIDTALLHHTFIDVLGDEKIMMSERDFAALNEYMTANIPRADQPEALKLANRYMNLSGATVTGYQIIRELLAEKEVPLEAAHLGITKTGVKGLEQFGVMTGHVTRELMDADMSDDVLDKITDSELYQGILQKVYRVDLAEFGDTTNEGIDQLLAYFRGAKSEGRIKPLDPHYTRQATEIATLGAPVEKISLTDDAKARYETLRGDIHRAVEALSAEHPFEVLLAELGRKIVDEIETIEREIDSLEAVDRTDKAFEFKQKNLNLKRETLKSLMERAGEGAYVGGHDFVMRSPEDLSTVFNQLEPFAALHDDMRQLVFAWALRNKPETAERLKELAAEPSVDDMGSVRSFVEHIVNNETFGNYFDDKKIATKFKKLTSVRSIDEALVRHQQEAATTGQQLLNIIPTRGFAMELSGHVGDACWASKYESMAEEFPNMTSLIFKRGEDGSQNERLVGSAMLIETKDDQGDDVLLLRGVNPIENFINKVRVEDFYRIVTEYCRDVARSKGMKPAIVIDTEAGRAGTNRPVLHEFMARMRDAGLENVAVDHDSTFFNGYDVTQRSYAL